MTLVRPWYSKDGLYMRFRGSTARQIVKPTISSKLQIARVSAAGTVVTTPPPASSNGTADPGVVTTRPAESSTIVWYETLYKNTDTSVNDTLFHLEDDPNMAVHQGKVVSFPAGVFLITDFENSSRVYYSGIYVPKTCGGIAGMGSGVQAWIAGSTDQTGATVFRMVANSSTRASAVPAQDNTTHVPMAVLKTGSSPKLVLQDFRVECTEQGHIFDGINMFNAPNNTVAQRLLITGWSGDNGAPPGETFGITIAGAKTINLAMIDVMVDSRRLPTGNICYGASGVGLASCAKSYGLRVTAWYCRANPGVVYQGFDITWTNCIFDAPSCPSAQGVGGGSIPGFNTERGGGIKIIGGVVNGRLNRSNSAGVNITHSNDSYTATMGGVSYSTANGSLLCQGVSFNNMWGNGKPYIQSWNPYSNGDTMLPAAANPQTAKPTSIHVVDANGNATVTWKWIHGGGIDVTG